MLFPHRSALWLVGCCAFWSSFRNFDSTISIDVIRMKSYMVASLSLRVYQWGSRSINLTSFQTGRCPVSLACSKTAEVCVRASRISLSCSFILSCIALPVSPISVFICTKAHKDNETNSQQRTYAGIYIYCGSTLHKRCIRGSSPLPTTTRHTHRLQIRHWQLLGLT